MNRFSPRWFGICILQFAVISLCHAQNKNVQNKLQPPPSNITVDGDLKDWGDTLRYYNQDKQLYYNLANDQDNIYMAIRINDRSQQIRVLRAGLTLSIDTRGKKKESFSITFPVGDQSKDAMMQEAGDLQGGGDVTQQDRDDLAKARLTKLREIRVVGFKDIEGEMITTSNTYGIKTAIDYDKDGHLVYEAAIPLKFFHADDLAKSEWAFNFKINGITRQGQNPNNPDQDGPGRAGRGGGGMSGGGGGRGGRGGGRGGHMGGGNSAPVDRSELSKSVDFWEKYYLAK
jgi:hypothetical protein